MRVTMFWIDFAHLCPGPAPDGLARAMALVESDYHVQDPALAVPLEGSHFRVKDGLSRSQSLSTLGDCRVSS
jgi:hypothetical protein